MAQIKNLIAKWGAAWPSPMIISRQYDNGQYRIDLFNYPEPEHIVDEQTEQMEVLSYYLIVWMKETEGGEPREMSPIQLPGPYWIVPNYYTQLVQDIRFQFCVQSDSTDYEAHSAIFTGRIVDSIEHDGDPIDVTPAEMFDAYKAYIQEIAMAAGAVVIDPNLDTAGAAAEAAAVGAALSNTNERLGQVTDVESGGPQTIDIDTSGITRFADSKITSTNHNINDSTGGHSVLWLPITISGVYTVRFSVSSQAIALVYQNITQRSDIVSSNYVATIPAVEGSPGVKQGRIEAGQNLVCSAWSSDYTLTVTCVTDGGEEVLILKQTIGLTEQMETEVDAKIDTAASVLDANAVTVAHNVKSEKWLPVLGAWGQGYYRGYNTPSNTALYRVRLNDILEFDRDTFLLADTGFYICGYFDGGTAIDRKTVVFVAAGAKCNIYIRRISENTSESADVEAFSSAVRYSTPDSDMVRFQHTFTDVSMFERVGICGDSYAAGGGIISGVKPLTWGKNLERQAGITVDLFARSGQSVVGWITDEATGLPALVAGEECGLYWMQHGINGTSTAAALGTAEDMSASPHPQTFYGQYVEAIEQVQAAYPNARIILASVIGSSWSHGQESLANVNAAIQEIAEHCSVPFVDITEDEFFKSTWYQKYIRSSHPTAMQCPGMAAAYRRLIAKCIMDNPSYFINYGNRYDPVT